jgi:hypothetical protein
MFAHVYLWKIPSISRARLAIISAAIAYILGVLVDITMVHTGSSFAISTRDNIVGKANASDSVIQTDNNGEHLKAFKRIKDEMVGIA